MGVTLIINPGSSSKKYALFDGAELLLGMRFEQTGSGFSVCTEMKGMKGHCEDISATDFSQALQMTINHAKADKTIQSEQDIKSIGIRIVAPGSYFTEHRVIDAPYVEKLATLKAVAPLHIPSMLVEIETVQALLPEVTLVGVSDSAFHTTVSSHISSTSLPKDDVERFDLKKFGYHGLSVASIVQRIKKQYGTIPENVLVCHIGSGVSVTALKDGKSVATSMGYSPASGTMMSSRMGDVPADMMVASIVRKNLRGEAILQYMYKEGGFKGVTGLQDLRLVLDRAMKHDMDAQKALDMFVYQVRSVIGSYAMLLGSIDTIVLTATAAERNPLVRSLLLGNIKLLSTSVDEEKNEALLNGEGCIQTEESKVEILVLKTNEMGEMLRVVESVTS